VPESPHASLAPELSESRLATIRADLDRRFSDELVASSSLNARGAVIAGLSGVMILLVAEFAGTWLDSRWEFPDFADTALDYLAEGSVLVLLIGAFVAAWAVLPQRRWRAELRGLVAKVASGSPLRAQVELLLTMTEKQRIRNEGKTSRLRWAYIAFALGTLLVAAQGAIFIGWADSQGTARGGAPASPSFLAQPKADALGLSRTEQDELARAYAPTIWLHKTDPYGPNEPSAFITDSSLQWRTRRGKGVTVARRGEIEERRLGGACVTAPDGCYSFAGYSAAELTRPHHPSPDRPFGLGLAFGLFLDPSPSVYRGQALRDVDLPVFYELRIQRRLRDVRLTYWFFYGYSRPYKPLGQNAASLVHEGDWENIDVALNLDLKPVAVYYYGHGKPQRTPWSTVCKITDEAERCDSSQPGHPIVFSAKGSHASYPTPGAKKVCLGPICATDERNRGWAWEPWTRPGLVRSVREQAWYGFGGAWGGAGRIADSTGPLGPSRFKLPSDRDPGDLGPSTTPSAAGQS
jgi:hypothetical protein